MLRSMTKLVGVGLIILGVWGFAANGFGLEPSPLGGLVPVNAVTNLIHLGIGVWGYASSRSRDHAGHFCRWAGVAFLAMGGGAFASENPAGLLPLGGYGMHLHIALGAFLLLCGLVHAARPSDVRARR